MQYAIMEKKYEMNDDGSYDVYDLERIGTLSNVTEIFIKILSENKGIAIFPYWNDESKKGITPPDGFCIENENGVPLMELMREN